MAKCKCRACGKPLESTVAYKVTIGKMNRYYCNEAEYTADEQKKRKEQADKEIVYNIVCKIFGYRVQNSVLFKEWKDWNLLKSNEIISEYLSENEEYLTQAIGRLTSGEYAKIRYFSTILKNSLVDYRSKVIDTPKVKVVELSGFELFTPTIQQTETKQVLYDVEDDLI